MDIEARRKYDRENKQLQRKLNTPYAQRVREAKRSVEANKKRRERRHLPDQRLKERLYVREYRQRPEAKVKDAARYAVRQALVKGILQRPENCELCGKPDKPLRDGRSGLRADHYAGYDKANHLTVKFICVGCDGRQLRKDYENASK